MSAVATNHAIIETNRLNPRLIRSTKKPEKISLTLRLEPNLHERATSLIERTEARNLQEVIRQGLELYEALVAEAEAGKDIRISDPAGLDSYSLFEN